MREDSEGLTLTRKLYLTLIEILIVLTIVLLVMGVIGFNIRKAMISQRFNTEVSLFVDSLKLSQDLMLVLSKDVYVKIRSSQDGSGIEYWIEVEGGIPKKWEPVIKRSHRIMGSTHYIGFNRKDSFPSTPGEIVLRFQSKGSMMSQGVVQLSTHEDFHSNVALRRSVCLRGYPHAINSIAVFKSPSSDEDWIPCEEDEEEEGYYEQLTLYTKEEILEDVSSGEKEQSPSSEAVDK